MSKKERRKGNTIKYVKVNLVLVETSCKDGNMGACTSKWRWWSFGQFLATFQPGIPLSPSRGDLGERSVPAPWNPSPPSDKSKQSAGLFLSSCRTSLLVIKQAHRPELILTHPASLFTRQLNVSNEKHRRFSGFSVKRRDIDRLKKRKEEQEGGLAEEERRDVWEHGPPRPQLLPQLHGPVEQQHQGAGHHPPLPLLGHLLPGRLHQVEGVDGSPLQCQPSVYCICPGRLHKAHIQVPANP